MIRLRRTRVVPFVLAPLLTTCKATSRTSADSAERERAVEAQVTEAQVVKAAPKTSPEVRTGEPGTYPLLPRNLDFELGKQSNGFPVGWRGGGDGYELTIDEEVPHAGRASGRIAQIETTREPWATLTQCIAPQAWLGQRVRYSGFVRIHGDGGAGLWLRVDRPHDDGAFDNMSDRPVFEADDWVRCEIVLDVAPDAVGICFGMLIEGDGTAWVDDLHFEIVGRDVATTEPTDGG